jgi:long-chain fatty acid transport protein
MRIKLLSLSVMVIGAVGGVLASQAQASGYNFGSQSVSAQGSAHANGAEAADPTTIYYNPAGMSLLDGDQISVGLTDVIPNSTFTNNGSKTVLGTPTSGGPGDGFAPASVVAPNFYATHQVNDKVTLGLGIFVPYGAELNYGDSWVGRYALESISLKTLNFNPSIAFKLDERQSFGFGVSAQYMKANLSKAVDVNSGMQIVSGGLFPAVGDGQASFSADGWGFGFNLGYMFKLDDSTRFGLAYRSEIHQKLTGNAVWDYSGVGNPIAAAAAQGLHASSAGSTDVTTPQSASANFYHDLNDKWAVMGNATWTGHSSMNDIDIKFDGTNAGDLVINQQWKNAWLFALGANYKYSDTLLLRSGIAFDQSPVSNVDLTHPALPDSNRYWLSLGANYKFNKQSSLDFAYSYVFFENANVNYTDGCNPLASSCTGNGETTTGSYKTNMQLVGVQYNYRF